MAINLFRNVRGRRSLFLCLIMGAAWMASGQSEKNQPADIGSLRAEVRRLNSELLQHRAEFIEWKMQWLKAELQQVQAERHRLSSERQLIEREIGELNQASTNNPGAEDEGRKEELNTVQVPALLANERAASARETTLAGALGAENAQAMEIRKQMQRLAASSNHD